MAKKKDAGEQEEGKKKGGLLKWIIILILLLGLAGGGFFAYMHFFANADSKKSSSANATEEQAQEEESEEANGDDGEPLPPPQLVSLPSFVVNLSDPLGRRYLKISLDMEVGSENVATKVENEMPKIKDKLLLLLSSKSYSDLASIEAKMELKNEIVNRINQVLGKGSVKKVYFTEFIIQ